MSDTQPTGQAHGATADLTLSLLAQILPVSFVQNLFFIHLIHCKISERQARKNAKKLVLKRKPKREADFSAVFHRKWPRSSRVLPRFVTVITFILYRIIVTILPLYGSRPEWFMSLILLMRAVLFSNSFVSHSDSRNGELILQKAMLGCVMVSSAHSLGYRESQGLLHYLKSNFAVQTLGMDFIWWATSVTIWYFWCHPNMVRVTE